MPFLYELEVHEAIYEPPSIFYGNNAPQSTQVVLYM